MRQQDLTFAGDYSVSGQARSKLRYWSARQDARTFLIMASAPDPTRVATTSASAEPPDVASRRFEGEALDNIADLSFAQGQNEVARAHFEAALAIHREVGNRRAEGIVLGHLSTLNLEESRIEEARELLSKGAALLRAAEYPIELGKLLCTRAELERRTGHARAARDTLAEVEAIAAQAGARPESELGRRLASVRLALAGNPAH